MKFDNAFFTYSVGLGFILGTSFMMFLLALV